MIDLLQAGQELQSFCDARGWPSCFIGGIAVQRWGEPRVTRDLDLSLLAGFGSEDQYIDALLTHYQPRMSGAKEFARSNRVLLLQTSTLLGIDISLAALPFEERVIRRATNFGFAPGVELRTCAAEDLVVLKLFAFRALDVHDAESIAVRQRDKLDWRYIEEQLRPLAEAKEEPQILLTLDRIRRISSAT